MAFFFIEYAIANDCFRGLPASYSVLTFFENDSGLPGDRQFQTFDEWQTLKRGALGAEDEWKRLPGEEARRKVAADRASAEADRAEKAAIGNQEYITGTGRDLGDRRMRFDARHAANQQVSGLQRDTGLQQALAKAQENVRKDQEEVVKAMEHSSRLASEVTRKMQEHNKILLELQKQVRELHGTAPRTY